MGAMNARCRFPGGPPMGTPTHRLVTATVKQNRRVSLLRRQAALTLAISLLFISSSQGQQGSPDPEQAIAEWVKLGGQVFRDEVLGEQADCRRCRS